MYSALFLSIFAFACLNQCVFGNTAQNWGTHTLRGWWNPDSSGPEPNTTLTGYDYIVVGTGAGGASLAARLGLAGHRVLVIEAGEDVTLSDNNVTIPAFCAKSNEDDRLAWSFFVQHSPNLTQNVLDPKFNYRLSNGSLYTGLDPPAGASPLGILYPRAAALGGCTVHNYLVMMYPFDSDWDAIASLTGDSSWNATGMRDYYELLEKNLYLPEGTPGHGFNGYLAVNRAETSIFTVDNNFYQMMKAASDLTGNVVSSVSELVKLWLRDLNAGPTSSVTESGSGLYLTPLNIGRYERSTPRHFLYQASQALRSQKRSHGGAIDIRMNCLATRVIFAPNSNRAIGVEFLDGESVYRADPRSSLDGSTGTPGVAFASKEIILAGGTYNTPQLLKLSGVGPAAELNKFGIPIVADLAGVGKNLQDRVENSVITNASAPWTIFEDCTLSGNSSDPCFRQWETQKDNSTKYSTNGYPAIIPWRSPNAVNADNDMTMSPGAGYFAGYFPGFSSIGAKYPNAFVWPVLKGHTQNRAGVVELTSDNPRDTPYINFNNLAYGTGDWQLDADAVVEAMQFARHVIANYATATDTSVNEIYPGENISSTAALREWVQHTSWGHHACCSAAIGSDDDADAVLDSSFRVRKTTGLRVVDASVFPRIPGFFIQIPIYAVSEKAADVILADAGKWEN